MIGAYPIYRLASRTVGRLAAQASKVRILMYHRVQSHPRSQPYLPPEYFADQIAYLAEAGYRFLALADLARDWPEVLDGPRTVVLTFDDVWASHVDNVLPVLKRHNARGTFFVPTAHIERSRHRPRFSDLALFDAELCSWPDVETLHAEGMEIGSHGHSHLSLAGLRVRRRREELALSRRILFEHLGCQPVSFCYPFGKNRDLVPGLVEMVAAQGYKAACTSVWGCPAAGDVLLLPRIGIDGNDDLCNFKRKMQGCYDFKRWIHRWR